MSTPVESADAGGAADDAALDTADPDAGLSAGVAVGGVATAQPVVLRSCSRIGRVANPPGFSFARWFRAGRTR